MLKNLIKTILPNTIKEKLFNIIYSYSDVCSFKSYSQEGEDMILRRLFENQQNGFYIDIGAHHPKRFSNTYFFYKKKWRGINIDAMPNSMKLFDKLRPRDINIEKPISDKRQVLTYYAFNEPALNGFSKDLSNDRIHKSNGKYFIKFTKNIETETLESILNENMPNNKIIDFLSIDVEGLDFLVLKSNNFNKHRPRVILIEILRCSLSDIKNNEIFKFLECMNYSIYGKSVNTFIFINNDFYKDINQ